MNLEDILTDFEGKWFAKAGVFKDFCPRQGVDWLLICTRALQKDRDELLAALRSAARKLSKVGYSGTEFFDLVARVESAKEP